MAPHRGDADRVSFAPDFLVVGAAKCGTSSLYAYLGQHPQLFVPEMKEPHFFSVDPAVGPQGWTAVLAETWGVVSDPVAYAALFDGADGRLTGEFSTGYLCDPSVPARVVAANPNTRIIAILRDPVERAISSWKMQTRSGLESLDFADAIADDDARTAPNGFLHRAHRNTGLYATHLARWEQCFDREQMLVLLTEDLDVHRVEVCQRVFAFLGVDDSFIPATDFEQNRSDQFGIARSESPRSTVAGPALHRSRSETLALNLRHSPLGRLVARMVPQRTRRMARNTLKPPAFRTGFGEVSEDVKQQLRDSYRPEILALQDRYGFDLTHWMSGSR